MGNCSACILLPRETPYDSKDAPGFHSSKEDKAMRKSLRLSAITLALATTAGAFLILPSTVSAQRRHVVIVERGPFFNPFFVYPYPYPYSYMAANYGEVKLDTHQKDAAVYIDGGYAGTTPKAKKFALRPGTHELEVRDSDGQTLYQDHVAVMIGHTTKVKVA